MNYLRKPFPLLPLFFGFLSLAFFIPGIAVMEKTRAWGPTMMITFPALLLGVMSVALGMLILTKKPQGSVYGQAMTGSITGAFSVLFWLVMVPMMMIFALPARDADTSEPMVEQSQEQMRVWVRHIKTFHRDQGRMPVKLEELVEKGYAPVYLLYDPRQLSKDAPSYRLMLREMPPESEWGTSPVLEGRIPNPKDGTRWVAYLDESFSTVGP
ncbi:hypothetical protein P3T73_15415 [Kiritimatiellota bacterium B12222]|nr:hypothetical protein P3T73_15415 [Kiritimatiellota bacterium B12222]